MARKNDSPQKAAMREMMCGCLKNNAISIKNSLNGHSKNTVYEVLKTNMTGRKKGFVLRL